MMRRRRYGAYAAAATALMLILTACAPGGASDEVSTADARPVTTEEAQVLASMRFRNFDAGARTVSFTVTENGDAHVDGWFDFTSHIGYASLDAAGSPELLLWNDEVSGTAIEPAGAADDLPLPLPDQTELAQNWTGGPLDPSSSQLDAMLSIIVTLGADRPDNPLLLQQSGALWLAERTVDGTALTIFAGPASDDALAAGEIADPDAATTRYWLDDAGLAHRVDVRLGAQAEWTTITFGEAPGIELSDPFAAPQS